MSEKFLTKKLSKFLGTIVLCLILIFLNPRGIFNPLQSFFLRAAYPFQKFFYLSGKSFSSSWKTAGSISRLRSENEQLLKENYFLQAELVKVKNEKNENEILRQQLGLIPKAKFDLEASFVVGQDPQKTGNWLMIDKGKEKGIEPGMPVIFSDGILIGRIEEVFSQSSKIALLSGSQSAVNAFDLETGARGIIKGEYGLGIIFDMVSQKDFLNVGDQVVTSGLGSEMPKGLLIGKIQEIRMSSDKLFQQAIINPSVKYSSLDVVFVIKK